MTATLRIVLAAAALALAACGGGEPAATTPDSSGAAVTLPTWQLEDVQPASPRVGQTYGLDTFSGKIVVVTLVEGY